MANTPSVGPTHPEQNKPPKSVTPNKENIKPFPKDSGKTPPQSFAQSAWGFDAAEAKKFLTTLANTIITQIKHEDELAKAAADKLKQAEQGEDS